MLIAQFYIFFMQHRVCRRLSITFINLNTALPKFNFGLFSFLLFSQPHRPRSILNTMLIVCARALTAHYAGKHITLMRTLLINKLVSCMCVCVKMELKIGIAAETECYAERRYDSACTERHSKAENEWIVKIQLNCTRRNESENRHSRTWFCFFRRPHFSELIFFLSIAVSLVSLSA